MIRRSLLWAAAGLACCLLAACAGNRRMPEDAAPRDLSNPNYSSIYYFLSGSYVAAQGDLQLADLLLGKAIEYDLGSYQLRKRLLLNAHKLFLSGETGRERVDGLLDLYLPMLGTDEEVLYSNYHYYDALADTTSLRNTIKSIQRLYPSAQADLQRFLFELKYYNRDDRELLNSSLQKAQNTPQTLQLLARIFSYFDREKEKQALLRLWVLDPSEQNRASLAGYIVRNQDLALASEYVSELEYPHDLAGFQSLADEALSAPGDSVLLAVAPAFIATKDLALLQALALEALLAGRDDVLSQIEDIVAEVSAPSPDSQPLQALLIAHSILRGEYDALDGNLAKLEETRYYNDILAYYNYAVNGGLTEDWSIRDPNAYAAFAAQIGQRLADAPPARYLLALVSAVQDSAGADFTEARASLADYLRKRVTLSAGDYEFLMSRHLRRGEEEQRRALLLEAHAIYPDNPGFCNDLGYSMLISKGDMNEAGRLIRLAVAVDPENPYYLDSLAWYHYLQGDYELAKEHIAIPETLEDMPAEIAWHIGAIYYQLGDLDKARVYLERSVAQEGDPASSAQAEQLLKQLP